ncbi:MAG: hypothetical protein JST00_33940 [Deltaproteobacteria bacterium]|nr:hypothetical protein [Deltaproteobacteria bacterium]
MRSKATTLVVSSLGFGLAVLSAACGAIVGIRDVGDQPVNGEAGIDSSMQVDASPDAQGDASTDAPVTGFDTGEAHFLQAGDQVGIEYVTMAGATKSLTIAANGPFTLPERARAATVKSAPAGKRCWQRTANGKLDVRCVLMATTKIAPYTTDSATFVAVPGAEQTFTTDLPSSTMLVALSIPWLTTSGPEVIHPAYSTAYVRAIIDNDTTKSIDLTRASTYWHQPGMHLLVGTVEVGPGAHTLSVELRHTVPSPVAGRTAIFGGTVDDGGTPFDFKPELIHVALESMETFDRLHKAPLGSEVLLPPADANQWKPAGSLSVPIPAPRKAVVAAYYPEVSVQSPGAGVAGTFALMAGPDVLASYELAHLQDEGGVRGVTMVRGLSANAPLSVRVDHRTVLGPNRISLKNGAAISAMLFSDASSVQSWTFAGDTDFDTPVDEWQTVVGSKQAVKTRGKAIVFLSLNRTATTIAGGSHELALFDGDTEIARGFGQSWSFEYSQGQPLATVVDFGTPGTHEISLRIRKKVGIPKLRHGTVPDGRGLSAITVLPIE